MGSNGIPAGPDLSISRAAKLALLVQAAHLAACAGDKGGDQGEDQFCEEDYEEEGALPSGWSTNQSSYACSGTGKAYAFKVSYSTFNGGAQMSQATMESLFDTSANDWNGLGADITIARGSECLVGDSKVDTNDGTQCIFYGGKSLSGAAAVADASCNHTTDSNVCCHTECDIQFYHKDPNDNLLPWTSSSSPSTSAHQLSMGAFLVHELGHPIGLDDQTPANNVGDSIMDLNAAYDSNGDMTSVSYTSPGSKDQAALVWIYGTP